jgi:hypothetical protein
LEKILLEKNYIPDAKFDWSLGQGQNYKKLDPKSRHSSISSCDIESN